MLSLSCQNHAHTSSHLKQCCQWNSTSWRQDKQCLHICTVCCRLRREKSADRLRDTSIVSATIRYYSAAKISFKSHRQHTDGLFVVTECETFPLDLRRTLMVHQLKVNCPDARLTMCSGFSQLRNEFGASCVENCCLCAGCEY